MNIQHISIYPLLGCSPHTRGSNAAEAGRDESSLASGLSAFGCPPPAGFLFAGLGLCYNCGAVADLAHHVVRSEGIRNPDGALRIIAPLPVHQKTVVVSAGGQANGGLPDSVDLFHQLDGVALPMSKVTYQLNTVSLRSTVKELLSRL